MPNNHLPEPWRSFLSDIDSTLREKVEFHCIGGFATTMAYGLLRSTADVDVIAVAPVTTRKPLLELAGQFSPLHKKHGVYLDMVAIVTLPENYDERMIEMFPGNFTNLRLYALDPYDLALSKLERNAQRDRDDVKHLARTVPLDLVQLRDRYETELKPYLAPSIAVREGNTLRLWVEAIEEERAIQ
jgi:hypothetical protein